jgi:DNA polymerase-3 subunit delta'
MTAWACDDRAVSSPEPSSTIDVWADVVGQHAAVEQLRAALTNPLHAYLFVGPSGSGKRAAMRAFAAELLAAGVADPVEADRHRHLALGEHHPDLAVIEAEGAFFRGGRLKDSGDSEAVRLVREAFRSPLEADRKVVVAVGFHTANDAAVGSLLKTLEEPPDRTILVLLADSVPDEQSAIASRCARIDFPPLAPDELGRVLVAEGVDPARASEVVALAGGDLARARVLATDDRLAGRVAAWREVPLRLDGTGARASDLVADLRAMIDDAMAPLRAVHAAEAERFAADVERYGLKGVAGQRSELERRHKRVERRFRTDELRLGLGNLAAVYRDEVAVSARPEPALAALAAIQATVEALVVNPNEELALQALFLNLPALRP